MTNPNPSPELKGCPFCGGESEAVCLRTGEDSVLSWVRCLSCHARTDEVEDAYSDLPTARAKWNTRALSQTLPPGEVERAAVVAYIRRQSERGADIGNEKPKGSTARAAFVGGSLALKRVADNIEAREHILNDNSFLATVAAANDEAFARGVEAAAKIADAYLATEADGDHQKHGRTIAAAIRLLSQGGGKA